MKKKYIYIIIIILLISIGYAYLNTDLTLANNVTLNPLSRYTVTFNTNGGDINRFEGKEIVFLNSAGIISHTLNNNVYTIETEYTYPAISLPTELFETGKTYTLKYKVKKLSGELKKLGGHCLCTTKISLKLDGTEISDSYNLISVNDDNLTHEIEYKFLINDNEDKRVHIQPNRSDGAYIKYELWDIQVIEEGYTETKTVTLNTTYGDLPTPVRAGYTFKGWNGKNLFDQEKLLMAVPGATYNNGYYIFNSLNAQQMYGGAGLPIPVSSDKTYTFSLNGFMESGSFYIGFYYTDETRDRIQLKSTTETNMTVTSSKQINTTYTSYGSPNGITHIKYIQLEEGNTATTYEPYYVTSGVNVTQAKDHTLTAIWEAN